MTIMKGLRGLLACLLRAEASRYFTITIKHQPWLGLAALPGHGKSRTEELSGDNRSEPRKWLGARMTGTNKQITSQARTGRMSPVAPGSHTPLWTLICMDNCDAERLIP